MKYLLIVVLSIISLFSSAQISNGTYKSSIESYRANYFLIVNDNQVTLFGWEALENDTIYFRSTAKFDSNKSLTFDEFEFQKEQLTEKNLNAFKADNNIKMEFFLLHRYLMSVKESNEHIKLMATKDIYDSRADAFDFKKI